MFSLDLQPNEKLFKIYRQSEWILAKTALIVCVAIYIPAFLLLRADLFINFSKIFLVWSILVFLYGLYHFILWLVNSYIITDKRLIVAHYRSLFKKRVMECPLNHIQNVSYTTTGFFSSMLNFGDVEVRVAGLHEPFVLKGLRKPENLKTFLWSLHSSNYQSQPVHEQNRIQ